MKRILALILVLVLTVACVGCSGRKRKPIQLTLNSEDSAAILAAAGVKLPDLEEAKGANSVVKWYYWENIFENYDEGEIVNTGYWTFQEKYGGSITFVETTYDERNTKLANLLLSGDSPDLYTAGTSNFAMYPSNCLKNMFQPIDDYIDYENDPLWKGVADVADYYLLKGRHYAIVTEVIFKDVIPYNRRVIVDDWGFDDPAELYANDEWTWGNFLDMCLEFNDPDSDRYAVNGWYVVNGIAEVSTGRYIISRDEDGKFYSNLDDPFIEAGENIIYELCKNDCFYHNGNDYWALWDLDTGQGVREGKYLFWPAGIDQWGETVEEYAATYGDPREDELMFVPYPRNENGDGIYYLASNISGFSLVRGATNVDGALLLASCVRFKIMDPVVQAIDRKQRQDKLFWSDEMLDMYDHCQDLAAANFRAFYTGNLNQGAQDTYDKFEWGMCRTANPKSWAQLKEENKEQLQYYLDELNAEIDAYEYSPDGETPLE